MRLLLTISIALLSAPAAAVCLVEDFDEQLRTADTVFVASITDARIEQPTLLRDQKPYRINYSFVVRERLKGDPTKTNRLYVVRLYDDPTDSVDWDSPEEVRLSPGDNVLVVANGSTEVQLDFCTPTQSISNSALLSRARSVLAL